MRGQQCAGIGTREQRADLRGKRLCGAARKHVDDAIDERGFAQSRLPDHALHPTRGHRGHALLARDLQQLVTSVDFTLSGFTGRERLHAGVEQCNAADAFGREAEDFECHSAAHRVTRERKSWRRFAQDFFGHGPQ